MRIGFEDANTMNRKASIVEFILVVFMVIYTIHMLLCPKVFIFFI